MPRFIGAGGWIITGGYPSAAEGGYARGAGAGGAALQTPRPLSPQEQIYTQSEIVGEARTVGAVGTSQTVERQAPTGAQPVAAGGPVIRGAGGVLLNFAIGAAVRAAGLPGLVATVLNFVVGSARRSAGTTTVAGSGAPVGAYAGTAFGQLLADKDPWATETAQLRAESAARSVRIDALMATFEDTGDDVVMPGSVASGVPEEQSLPTPGLDTETGTPYAGGEPPAQDQPGPDFPSDGFPV